MLIILFFLTPALVVSAWFFHSEFRRIAQIADPSPREGILLYGYALLSLGPAECLLQYFMEVWLALEWHEYGLWTLRFLQLMAVGYATAKLLNRHDHVRAYRRRCEPSHVQSRE